MECINNCYILGCSTDCGNVVLSLCAKETGIHTLEFEWLGKINMIEIPGVCGELFKFKNPFNESGQTKFKIHQPTKGEYQIDNGVSCYQISMMPGTFKINRSFDKIFSTCAMKTINGVRYKTFITQLNGMQSVTLKICN